VRTYTKNCLDNITDTFTGADGGISFIKLKSLVEAMDQKAETGDIAAEQLIGILIKFNNLIKVANK
jgi:hypothetical protein